MGNRGWLSKEDLLRKTLKLYSGDISVSYQHFMTLNNFCSSMIDVFPLYFYGLIMLIADLNLSVHCCDMMQRNS
jgi:hypothetical protein